MTNCYTSSISSCCVLELYFYPLPLPFARQANRVPWAGCDLSSNPLGCCYTAQSPSGCASWMIQRSMRKNWPSCWGYYGTDWRRHYMNWWRTAQRPKKGWGCELLQLVIYSNVLPMDESRVQPLDGPVKHEFRWSNNSGVGKKSMKWNMFVVILSVHVRMYV